MNMFGAKSLSEIALKGLYPAMNTTLPFLMPSEFSVHRIAAALVALDDPLISDHAKNEFDFEDPVFLLAVGWRSGSTFVQRLLVSDPSILVWGEPLGNMGLITHITHALCIIDSGRWPRHDAWIKQNLSPDELVKSWIANLYPPASDFRLALQSLVYEWIGRPSRTRGYARWGLKEVRLGACEACLLAWLFPKARFIVVIRNPCDAYRSIIGADGAGWAESRVHSARGFSRHWNRLAMSWLDMPRDFPVLIVRYEDIVGSGSSIANIAEHTGLSLRPELVIPNRIGGSVVESRHLSWWEKRTIKNVAADGIRAFGYDV